MEERGDGEMRGRERRWREEKRVKEKSMNGRDRVKGWRDGIKRDVGSEDGVVEGS